MKQKHLYALLDGSYTTIGVVYQNGEGNGRSKAPAPPANTRMHPADLPGRPWDGDNTPQAYTFKALLDAGVAVDDFVVIQNASGAFAIVRVVRVDEHAVIDVDADHTYRWIVQKLDLAAYRDRLVQEQNFNAAMLEVERVKQREELVKSFHAALPEGSAARALFDQTTAKLQAPTVDVPPAPPSNG